MSTSKFCVYLTTYFGNKLPMFYIGSTTLIKFNNGYVGSVSSKKYSTIWKNEIRNNPTLFKTKLIAIFETRQEAFLKEEFLQKQLNVIKNPLYVNMSFANNKFTLKQHSIYTKLLFKKRVPWNKGKSGVYSEYTLSKMSNSKKGRPSKLLTEEQKEKLKGPNPKKSRPGNLNGMFGKTHTNEVKEKLSKNTTQRLYGKTYEELYGDEKAKQLKQARSIKLKEYLKQNPEVRKGSNNSNAKSYEFISPSNIVYQVHGNLRNFCKEHELELTATINLLKGRRAEYKGWTARYL